MENATKQAVNIAKECLVKHRGDREQAVTEAAFRITNERKLYHALTQPMLRQWLWDRVRVAAAQSRGSQTGITPPAKRDGGMEALAMTILDGHFIQGKCLGDATEADLLKEMQVREALSASNKIRAQFYSALRAGLVASGKERVRDHYTDEAAAELWVEAAA